MAKCQDPGISRRYSISSAPVTTTQSGWRRGATTAMPSLDSHAGDGSGDHQPLDLGGSFEDRVDLRIPVPPLDRVITHVPVAAEDLDGFFRDLDGGLAGEELGHRALTAGVRLAVRTHPRRALIEEAGSI